MNHELDLLQPYPFEKLRALHGGLTPPASLAPIALSIGEPKHAAPAFVTRVLQDNLDKLANYPATRGIPELRESIAYWCERRFQLARLCSEREVLPVNGTREALFAFAQACIDRHADHSSERPLVISPNPFYQIYEGAALLAGAEPHYLPCLPENGYQPDFAAVPASVWQRCQLIFLCSPGNPTGAVLPIETLQSLIRLADQHDFIIASDECYSEIYFDEQRPPPGLLQACAEMGRHEFNRCVVFHSLSKRSNLPGLRSGFVAGDADILAKFLQYRTYHGCAMPVQHQLASVAAWHDEDHVRANRARYRTKFESVLSILDDCMAVQLPDAGFYLWPQLPGSDTDFSRELFARENVIVLPGEYLGRTVNGHNPGSRHLRMALVASEDECREAAQRIRRFVTGGR